MISDIKIYTTDYLTEEQLSGREKLKTGPLLIQPNALKLKTLCLRSNSTIHFILSMKTDQWVYAKSLIKLSKNMLYSARIIPYNNSKIFHHIQQINIIENY